MSFYDVVIFEAKLTHVAKDRLGVYLPTWLGRLLEKKGHKGKKVIVHIYIPKEIGG